MEVINEDSSGGGAINSKQRKQVNSGRQMNEIEEQKEPIGRGIVE